MTVAGLDPTTVRRLAFIRLLYLQGVEQSRLPEPLAFTSVLSFHDAVELFLVLTGDHLSATLPDHLQFMKYFTELSPAKLSNGVDLSGKTAMDRLNRLRNGFKHAGALPGAAAVEQARAEVSAFLEDNTSKVFGIFFADVDLAYVVPQQGIRDQLRAAAATEAAGDRIEALAMLVDTFNEMFNSHVDEHGYHSRYSFGKNIQYPLQRDSIARTLRQPDRHDQFDLPRLAQQIDEMTDAVTEMQAGLRLVAIGVEYWKYLRFLDLTPGVSYTMDGRRHRSEDPSFAPTEDDFRHCYQFMISVALRLAEVQAHEVPVSARASRPWWLRA